MSRRSAVLIALTVGMCTVVVLVLAGRRRRPAALTGANWAPDPGPQSVASVPRSTGDVMEAATEARLDGGSTTDVAGEPAERPLPTWIRLTIVGVALLAFLAVSLIATKGV